MIPALYRAATALAGPAIEVHLRRRQAAGREDPDRAGERRGRPSLPRPPGPLVQVHAASVGESLSVLPLVARLRQARPDLAILVTTGTVTSARLMGARLPAGVIHQYATVDRMAWVRRFLDHWRPDLVLLAESELWPNTLLEIGRRGIPALLVNARMSPRSFARWQRLGGLARRLLGGFALCLAQSEADAERLRSLGAPRVAAVGNLKFAALPLPVDEAALTRARQAVGERPVWCAASTHPGEEAIVARAHGILARERPGLLTILVPRHAGRGPDIAAALDAVGIVTARRSAGETPGPETGVWLADTMGELGLFYRLAGIVFIGGSLVPHGGQNLLEPALLDSALLHGPHMTSFAEVAAAMQSAGATTGVRDAEGLALSVGSLLDQPGLRDARARAAAGVATARRDVLDRVMAELGPWLDDMAAERPRASP